MMSSSATGFRGINPVTGESLDPEYVDARLREIDGALASASEAAAEMRQLTGVEIALLMEAIAVALEARREEVIARCRVETGYALERVAGEFARMVDGMRMFGGVAKRGDWLNVRIDHGDESRTPVPKPDLRCMNVPIGPVVVFGASNFPLALSVAGSDVASALAAGCPVVVKGHPSHPGTSELLAQAILGGVATAKFPPGTFAMVQGASNEVGQALVEHPEARAVAFTGSLAGGRAIFDLAARREVPIPVYAEMGSVNPQFVFADLIKTDPTGFANRLFGAATMGNGQFCTNPGLVFLAEGSAAFIDAYRREVRQYPGAPMLNRGIKKAFERGIETWRKVSGLEILEQPAGAADVKIGTAAAVARISFEDFLQSAPIFQDEVFGPATVLIECASAEQFLVAARTFGGQLGASIHGTEVDLKTSAVRELLALIGGIVGRVLVNGFPTGLESCNALQHGGPYPATTDSHWTSVGAAAIERFGRPLAFQDVPDALLPAALKESNPLQIRRLVDGDYRSEG